MKAEHLYVHVPFCARRCVYCDFSIAVRARVPTDEYLRALDAELASRHRDSTLDLETLYFGGGTPSKLGEAVVELLDVVRRHASIRPDAEVTLEANPEDVSPESVRAWRTAGVNRVSLGVQSFDDQTLRWMHRTHDAKSAHRAVHVLRDQGLSNVSIDLIFAVPATVSRSWMRDIETAVDLGLPHISIYGLTVEAHTPLGRWVARQDVTEAPEESFEREFLEAHNRLSAAGFEHYEVSNYGKPGAHSRHNWAYWRRRPYGGVGPSSHEFDGLKRRWNVSAYADWVSRVSGGDDTTEGSEALTADQVMAEEAYLSLRTRTGVALSGIHESRVSRWIDAGWATVEGDSMLRLTTIGWLRLDALASDLTPLRSRY